jgi:hypothetical protein
MVAGAPCPIAPGSPVLWHASAPDDAWPSARPSIQGFVLKPGSGSCGPEAYLRKSPSTGALPVEQDTPGRKGLPRFMDKVCACLCPRGQLLPRAAARARALP